LEDTENLLALRLVELVLIASIRDVACQRCAGLGILGEDSESPRHGLCGQATMLEDSAENLLFLVVEVIVAHGQGSDAPGRR